MTPVPVSGLLLWVSLAAAPNDGGEEVRYLRLLPEKPAAECVFTLQRSPQGQRITSVTERGPIKMTVTTRSDARDALLDADALWTKGDEKKAVRVTVAGGKATV